MFAIGAWLAETALGKWFAGSAAKKLLTAIPLQVWQALAVIGYALALYATHQHAVHEHDKAIIAAEDQRIAKQALALKAKIDKLTVQITTAIRSKNDEENRAIAADAGRIRLLGPGRAACRPVISSAARGPVAPAAVPNDAGPALPPADFAAVPWPWLVDRAQEHDQLDAEALAWRTWYAKMVAAWPKAAPQQP